MRRLVEPAVFLGLATALHAGVWIGFGGGGGAAGGGGGSGAALVLEAGSAETVAMVRRWEAPPEIATGLASPLAPAPDEAPALPPLPPSDAPPAAPALPAPRAPEPEVAEPLPTAEAFAALPPEIALPTAPAAPDVPALPAPPVAEARPVVPALPRPGAPVPPTPVEASPDAEALVSAPPAEPVRPRPRPERRALRAPEAAAPSVLAQPPQAATAAGARQSADGGGGQAAPGQLRALEAQWGAAILARIARQQRYPAGEHGSGTARITLTVGRDGRLQDVRLAASSGSTALDRAAIAAVRRAGRFPAAPRELERGSYVFAVPMTFRRN